MPVTRTEEEIYAVIDEASVSTEKGRSRWPGMSFEDGVKEALFWVLGETESSPMEDE